MPKAIGNPDQFILYGGKVILDFDEAAHVYTLEGKVVPSTTQITKMMAKPFLQQWAASSASKFIKKQWQAEVAYTREAIENILKRSQFAHTNISTRATDIGSEVHNWIESFVLRVMETGEEWPEMEDFEEPTSMEAIYGAAAFLSWYRDNDVVFIETEKKIYSRKYHYSGTFDLLAMVNGVLTLVDFKTSKDIYEDNFVQGAAYIQAYHEEQKFLNGGRRVPAKKKVEQFMILHVPKTGNNYKTGTILADDLDKYFGVFIGCRAIYDWHHGHDYTEWGDGSIPKPTITKPKTKLGNFFPKYQQ